jgi:hypothetical protein
LDDASRSALRTILRKNVISFAVSRQLLVFGCGHRQKSSLGDAEKIVRTIEEISVRVMNKVVIHIANVAMAPHPNIPGKAPLT